MPAQRLHHLREYQRIVPAEPSNGDEPDDRIVRALEPCKHFTPDALETLGLGVFGARGHFAPVLIARRRWRASSVIARELRGSEAEVI